MNIYLEELVIKLWNVLYTCTVPKLAGDDILDENRISLREFIESKSNNELHDYKQKWVSEKSLK